MISTKHNFIIVFLTAYFMYSDSEVTPPEKDGYFYQIKSREQYTEYVLNADYAILFFNYSTVYFKPCEETAILLQKHMRLTKNRDIKIFEIDFDHKDDIAYEWNVSYAPSLISLQHGHKVERVIQVLVTCSRTVETFFEKLLGGHVTVPILNDGFHQIQIYTQFREYTLKEPYAVLFFNISNNDEIINTTVNSLKEQMKKPANSAVKIYEVDIDNLNAVNIKHAIKWKVNEAPYLISLRTGNPVEHLIPSKAPSPLSLDSFFSKLVGE